MRLSKVREMMGNTGCFTILAHTVIIIFLHDVYFNKKTV